MGTIFVWGCLLAVLIEPCMSDMYMHFPHGSNNRLNGNQDNVRNANRLFDSQVGPRGGGGGGVLEVYMTGGSDVFFWVENLHARYFFGSRDLSRIFLGFKKIRVFFWVLSPNELFVSDFRCSQWTRKIFIRTSF